MGTGNLTDEFQRGAVAPITERGYPTKAVSKRLGASTHSLCAGKRIGDPPREDHAGVPVHDLHW